MAFCLLAYVGSAGLAGQVRGVLEPKIGTSHAAVIRYTILLLGSLAAILITLQLFGIAAQQSLSNVFAGMVLLLARPVNVGDPVLIKSGVLGGDLRGNVAEIGITYVRLDTPDGPLHLPNSQVLAAAIAPAVSSPADRT